MATLASVVVRVGADITGFTTNMKRAATLSERQGKKMERAMVNATRAISTAAVTGFALAVNEARKFETAMAEVSTLLEDTSGMDALSDSVRAVSREFGKAPVEEAKALYQIISAGASTASDQMTLLTASNKLAVGGITEVDTAADALTSALNAYGMGASEASHFSDVLFAGMKGGKTTIGEMATSLGTVVTMAAQTGVSFEALIASVATVTKAGVGTSEAMAGLRGVLAAVLKQSDQSVKAFDKLAKATGLTGEFNVASLKEKGLAGFLNDINDAARKTGDPEGTLAKLFGRVEALSEVMALGAGGAAEFNKQLEGTQNAAGLTDEAVGRMSQTFEFQFNKLKTSITLLAESVGVLALPALNEFIQALNFLLTPTKSLEAATVDAAEAVHSLSNALRVNADIETHAAAVDQARAAWREYDRQILELEAKLIRQRPLFHEGAQQVKDLEEEIANLRRTQNTLVTGIAKSNRAMEDWAAISEVVVTGQMRAIPIFERTAQEIAEERRQIESLTKWFDQLTKRADPAAAAIEDFGFAAAKSMALVDAGIVPIERMGAAITGASNQMWENIFAQVDWQKETKKTADEAVGMAAVIENAWKRLDDTFADMWTNILTGAKTGLDAIKDLFLKTLGQMLHAAITQPIVLRIGAAMGIGGIGTAAAGDATSMLGGLGGGGLLGDIGQIGLGALGGGFLAKTLFGSDQSGFGGAIGGGLGSAFLGGFAGDLLGSFASSGIGTAIAGAIGPGLFTGIISAAVPLIGPLIGALVGGFIGDFFARDPRISVGTGSFGQGQKRDNFFDSGLGGFNIGNAAGGLEKFLPEAASAIKQFDDAIASFLNADQIGEITSALSDWEITLKKNAVSIENILGARFEVILSTFSDSAQDYVNSFDGLEAQSEALQKYVQALNTAGMALAAFVETDLNDFGKAAEQLSSSATLSQLGDDLRAAFDNFDNTPESLNNIAQLVDARYRAEIAYLTTIDTLVQNISASIGSQRADLQEIIDGPQAVRSFQSIFEEAQALAGGLGNADSPESIATIVSSVQSLVNQAMGGDLTAGQAQSLLDLINGVEQIALFRGSVLSDQAIAEGGALRTDAGAFGAALELPMNVNTEAVNNVGVAVESQTTAMREEHTEDRIAIGEVTTAVRSLNDRLDRALGADGRLKFVTSG